jgi:hypothetical protein
VRDNHLLDLESLGFLIPRGMETFFPDVRSHHDLSQLGRSTLTAFADRWEEAVIAHRQYLDRSCPPSHPRNRLLFMQDCVAALHRLTDEAHPQMPLAAPLRRNDHFDDSSFVVFGRTAWYDRRSPFTPHARTDHKPYPVRHVALMTGTELAFFAEHLNAFQRWLAIAQRDRFTHDGFTDFDTMHCAMNSLYRNTSLRARILNSVLRKE